MVTMQRLGSADKLALGLLHTKSEEIQSLEQTVAREQAKVGALMVKIQELEALKERAVSASNELERSCADAKQESAATEAKLADERTSWQMDRAVLESTIASLSNSKNSLEEDVKFFQTQYATASSFISGLQKTNQELTERVSIAESQVRVGLATMEASYKIRIATLEEDLGKSKGLCRLLQEKDERTGDDVRNRAAEAVELRVKVGKLQDDLEQLNLVVEGLEAEKEEWERKEFERLTERPRLLRSKSKGRIDSLQTGWDWEQDDWEEVYRCLWRTRGSETNDRCEQVFTSIRVSCCLWHDPLIAHFSDLPQALEDHACKAGHISHA